MPRGDIGARCPDLVRRDPILARAPLSRGLVLR